MTNWPAAYSFHRIISAYHHPGAILAFGLVTIIIIGVSIAAYQEEHHK